MATAQQFAFYPKLGNGFVAVNQKLPKDLLSGRAVVLVDTDSKQLISGDWKKISRELHQYLVRMKIDPVLYMYMGDYLSGRETTANFYTHLDSRDIQFLIVLEYFPGRGQEEIKLLLTTFHPEKSLMAPGQEGWQRSGSSIKEIAGALANDIIRAELPLNNFLIPDQPEFLEDIQLITKRKFPVYTTDIRIEKLAVPYFDSIYVKDPSKYPAQIISQINAYNTEVGRKNRELEQLMASYPYKYELMKYSDDGRYYFTRGFQFVLMGVEARGSSLKKLLDYDPGVNITHYVSQRNDAKPPITVKIPSEQHSHKFYIKHTISGNVYMGDVWDAGTTWQEALQNYITNSLVNAR